MSIKSTTARFEDPEPGTLPILSLGLAGLDITRRLKPQIIPADQRGQSLSDEAPEAVVELQRDELNRLLAEIRHLHDEISDEAPEAVVELQRDELNRLLAENRHLHDEIICLQEVVEREQVLRQKIQNQIEGVEERLALPSSETLSLERRLCETESNLALLKQAMWNLVLFLEGKQA